MWKSMIKYKLIGSIEILYVAELHMEHKDGLLLFRGCVKDSLAQLMKFHLVMSLEQVSLHQ